MSYLEDDDVSLQNPSYVAVPVLTGQQQPVYGRKEESSHATSYCRGYSWATYICIGVFIVFGIVAILATVGVDKANSNANALNAQIEQWHQVEEERNAHAEVASKTIVMDGEKRAITLCVLQSYHLIENKLVPLVESIESIRSDAMKDHDYYHVNVRLRLSFETRDTNTNSKKDKRELTISYNVTSSFMPFSSVRLEELEFNPLNHRAGPMRTIVLCSNDNEDLDVERCDTSLTKRQTLLLQGETTVPLVIAPLSMHKEAIQDLDQAAKEDDGEPEKGKRQQIGLRMYNIVFYQSESNGTSKRMKEQRSITLEPLQC